MRLSKLSLRLAEAPGVRLATGVLVHGPWAGEGVTLTKSAKLKFVPGVVGSKPKKPFPLVPGVMWEDGSGVDLQGGVVGGFRTLGLAWAWPAEGEVAR